MEKITVKFIKGLNIVRCDMRIYYTPPFYWVGTRNDYITYDQETKEKVVVELVNKELGMMCLN